jgi:hypothetical protein
MLRVTHGALVYAALLRMVLRNTVALRAAKVRAANRIPDVLRGID